MRCSNANGKTQKPLSKQKKKKKNINEKIYQNANGSFYLRIDKSGIPKSNYNWDEERLTELGSSTK